MFLVGLTGGIASGKSTCAALLAAYAPVIDADDVVRELYQPGNAGYDAVVKLFDTKVLRADKHIAADTLRRLIFSNDSARKRLESAIHPLVKREILAWRDRHAKHRYGVAQIPLLFESGERYVDCAVTTDCSPETQRKRALARGLSEAVVDTIMARQLSREQRLAKADYIINTDGDEALLPKQIVKLHYALSAAAQINTTA